MLPGYYISNKPTGKLWYSAVTRGLAEQIASPLLHLPSQGPGNTISQHTMGFAYSSLVSGRTKLPCLHGYSIKDYLGVFDLIRV